MFYIRGEKRSNYDKKDQSNESGNNDKSNQKLISTTSNDSKNSYGGKYIFKFKKYIY